MSGRGTALEAIADESVTTVANVCQQLFDVLAIGVSVTNSRVFSAGLEWPTAETVADEAFDALTPISLSVEIVFAFGPHIAIVNDIARQ